MKPRLVQVAVLGGAGRLCHHREGQTGRAAAGPAKASRPRLRAWADRASRRPPGRLACRRRGQRPRAWGWTTVGRELVTDLFQRGHEGVCGEGMTGSFFVGLASASAEIFCLSSAGSMEEVTGKLKMPSAPADEGLVHDVGAHVEGLVELTAVGVGGDVPAQDDGEKVLARAGLLGLGGLGAGGLAAAAAAELDCRDCRTL